MGVCLFSFSLVSWLIKLIFYFLFLFLFFGGGRGKQRDSLFEFNIEQLGYFVKVSN